MSGSKRNLCFRGRALRLCLAVLVSLGAFYFPGQGLWQMLAFGVAATLVLTAFIGFCPARFIVKKCSGGH